MKTFKCDFGNGITCEAHVTDTPPPKDSSHILEVIWGGKPTSKLVRPYIAWMNSVNKLLADEWNLKIMHVFQVGPKSLEAWMYEPNKLPKMIDRRAVPR